MFLTDELDVSELSKVKVPLLLQSVHSQLHIQHLRAARRRDIKTQLRFIEFWTLVILNTTLLFSIRTCRLCRCVILDQSEQCYLLVELYELSIAAITCHRSGLAGGC